jgi:CRISP-associated protein Cas1
MQLLYVTEPGSYLSKDGNRLSVRKDKDAVIKTIGIEHVEGVVLVGSCNLSSGLAIELLEREIPVTWLSSTGSFFGRLEPTSGYNIERQVEQFEMHKDNTFRISLARQWVVAKLENSRGVLRRYNRRRDEGTIEQRCEQMGDSIERAKNAESINELLGIEGTGARHYFSGVSTLMPEEFQFEGRSRRPPKDPFNSLISFGYTLLLYEVFTAIVAKNLHPYLGYLHQPRRGHPSLASDLMEEWRAVIVDSLAIGLLTSRQLKPEHFREPAEDGGVYLTRDGSKIFLEKFEKKLRSHNQYLTYVDYPLTFRESLAFQVGALVKAIQLKDHRSYRPVIVR